MKQTNIQKEPLIAAIFLYSFCNPYFMWGFMSGGYVRIIMTGLMAILFAINLDIKSRGRRSIFFVFLLVLVFSSISQGQNIVGFTASVMICVLPFGKEKFSKKTYDYFVTIYSFIIGISGVMWLLYLVGIAPILGNINPHNELKEYNYTVYPLLVQANDIRGKYRFFGPFDEPGVVGTISAILLTIGKFNLKDRRLLTIFITGFFSLSFFYYIIVTIYYVTYNLLLLKNKKKSFLIIALLAVFMILSYNNSVMYDNLWSRFEWDAQAGKFAGDNRISTAGEDFFESIIGTKEFYFGSPYYADFAEMVEGSASYISLIIKYGFVLISLFVYVFASYGWRYKNDKISYILFLFVFLSTIYQRPFIFDPSYIFLFSMMAISCGSLINEPKVKISYKL